MGYQDDTVIIVEQKSASRAFQAYGNALLEAGIMAQVHKSAVWIP